MRTRSLSEPINKATRASYPLSVLNRLISRIGFFCFCPETETEILNTLDLPFEGLGYGVWAERFHEVTKRRGVSKVEVVRASGVG
jgi:hypothetical protein